MNQIDKMFCQACSSEDCEIMICTEEGCVHINKKGIIVFSENNNANVGENIKSCYQNLNITYVSGSCNNCEDEASLRIYFKDGLFFQDADDALKHLVN